MTCGEARQETGWPVNHPVFCTREQDHDGDHLVSGPDYRISWPREGAACEVPA